MDRRRWTDARDGREWSISHNPVVELARPRERVLRSRMIFESEGERLQTEAVYGTDLQTLTDGDLEGLLDQARSAAAEEEGGREETGDGPGD